MKLQDIHKQFTVKSFAKMMTRAEVTATFMQEFEHDLPKPSITKPQYLNCDETYRKELQTYNEQLDEHIRKLREDISNQLRVYNITHNRFPLKYRQIYEQTQREYLAKLLTNPNANEDQIIQELLTLYGFIKRRILKGEIMLDLSSDIKLAHTLLKTIATTKP